MPFALIEERLNRLECTNRLVIVDACKAGAAVDAEAVERLSNAVGRNGQKSRNAYILAARGDSAAGEAKELGHGLLTYVILKGLASPGMSPPASLTSVFKARPNADLDRDGVVSSVELAAYVDDVMPDVAAAFPTQVERGATGGLKINVDPGGETRDVPLFRIVALPPSEASRP